MEQFEALVRALDPNMSPDSRQSLAAEYARLLIMTAEARRRGVDQTPEVRTLLEFSALQVLSTKLVQDISVQQSPVSDDDVERYYREHRRDYQEVSLSRILVPSKPNDIKHTDVPAAERASAIHDRANHGEDFVALQLDVAGGTRQTAGQHVDLGPMPCHSLPEEHQQVCDLQPGEVSKVLTDSLGYVIYRLESVRNTGLDEVRGAIRETLQRQRVQEQIEAIRTPVALDLNENYFGKLPAPDVAMHHGMHFPAASVTAPATAMPAHSH